MTDKMSNKPPLTVEEAIGTTSTETTAEVEAWHDGQTRKAIKEADAGNFVTVEELVAIVRKYAPNA